jgi:hypothetical protein
MGAGRIRHAEDGIDGLIGETVQTTASDEPPEERESEFSDVG